MRFSVSVVLAMAASVLAADPIVFSEPAPAVQCQTAQVTWTGGVAPFNLNVVHDRTAENFFNITERSFTWKVDLPANTLVWFSILDATSHTGQSSSFLVQPSTDNSCLH